MRPLLPLALIAFLAGAGPAPAQTADPAFGEAMGRGMVALEAGELADAIAAFSAALDLRPGHPEAQAWLGTALLETGDPAAARDVLAEAAAAAPDFYPARVALAGAHLALGNDAAAVIELRAAIDLEPEDAASRARLATTLVRRGELDEAALHAGRLARDLPNNPAVQSLYGVIELRRERFDPALAAFDAALAARPEAVDARYGRAAALNGLGRTEEAAGLLAALVEAAPAHAEAWMLLARMSAARDDIESRIAAVDFYRETIRLRPADPEPVQEMATLLRAAGLIDETITLLEGSPATPGSPELLLLLGRTLFEQERLEDARNVYERAIAAGGGAETWYRLGVVEVNLARLHAAEAAYREALDADPDFAVAARELANALLDRGSTEEAGTWIGRALTGLPDDPRTAYLAGLQALRAERPEDAIELLRRARTLAPDDADVIYNLGLALRASGAAEESRELLTRAQEMRRAEAAAEPPPLDDGEQLESLLRAGYLRYRIGSIAAAIEALEAATALAPEEERGWFWLGLARAEIEDTTGAIEALERAAAIRADRAETWEVLAGLYEQAGRGDEAAAAAERARSLRQDARAPADALTRWRSPPR